MKSVKTNIENAQSSNTTIGGQRDGGLSNGTLRGKCREVVQIPASGEASVSDPAPLDVLAGEFPMFGNREFSNNEQGLP